MDQVTLAKNQLRADSWRMPIQSCQQSGQTVVGWCEEKTVVFKQLEVTEVTSPLPNTQAAVIIRLPQATLEIADGTSQQTIQPVLLALQSVC